jgi:hypothetical protein
MGEWGRWAARSWNEFWFSPAPVSLLGLMRLAVGWMLFYTHLVWSLELNTFFSSQGVLVREFSRHEYGGSWAAWTHFDWLSSSGSIWVAHLAALGVMLMFALGLFTRVTSVLSFLLAVSYAHRGTGTLFGLDQINCFLTLYLAVGPSGAAWSLDSLWRRPAATRSVLARVALRLAQVHMCVVYLFAGLSKLRGDTWWMGEAMWDALASLDYQTLDLTWLAHHFWLINLMTLIALGWEVSYPFLVWHPRLRPVYLGLAVIVHAGIGVAMGMLTFAAIMLIGNMAFLSPAWGESCWQRWQSRGGDRSKA